MRKFLIGLAVLIIFVMFLIATNSDAKTQSGHGSRGIGGQRVVPIIPPTIVVLPVDILYGVDDVIQLLSDNDIPISATKPNQVDFYVEGRGGVINIYNSIKKGEKEHLKAVENNNKRIVESWSFRNLNIVMVIPSETTTLTAFDLEKILYSLTK